MDAINFSQPSVTINTGSQLQVLANNTGPYTNTANSPTINGNGSLNLNNSYLFTSSSSNTIQQDLTAGYNGGLWNGSAAASIVSTSANLSGQNPAASASPLTPTWPPTACRDDASHIPAGQTLVKYTTPGDANLLGHHRLHRLPGPAAHYQQSNSDWSQGDFN